MVALRPWAKGRSLPKALAACCASRTFGFTAWKLEGSHTLSTNTRGGHSCARKMALAP